MAEKDVSRRVLAPDERLEGIYGGAYQGDFFAAGDNFKRIPLQRA